MKKILSILFIFILLVIFILNSFAISYYSIWTRLTHPVLSEYQDFYIEDIDNSFTFYSGGNYVLQFSMSYYDGNSGAGYVSATTQYNENITLFSYSDYTDLLLYVDGIDSISVSYTDLVNGFVYYKFTPSCNITVNDVVGFTSGQNPRCLVSYYDSQSYLPSAGQSIMNIVVNYLTESTSHWVMLLFFVVIPVLSFMIAIIVSFKERSDKK